MKGFALLLVASSFGAHGLNSTASLCNGGSVVTPDATWIWSTAAVPSPSCVHPEVVNNAQMCQGDPTSIVIQASGQAECLAAQMDDCRFNMHDLDQLDFDVNMVGCKGTWAAPLWMTPDTWYGGAASGEIDMMENCYWDQVRSNFAGGSSDNQEVSWTQGSHVVGTGDDFKSHTTLRKQADEDGVMSIFVRTCRQTEVGSDGSCPNDDGQAHQRDIYGKYGCSNGGDCMYKMVSDLWNGDDGDDGWTGCTGRSTNFGSQCKFSVTNIRTQGVQFSGKCGAMAGASPTPPPPPPSASCDANPVCHSAGLTGVCCPTDDGDMLGCCGSSPTPSPSCAAHPACQSAGLTGDCCPTDDDVMLGCCSSLSEVMGTSYEVV